MIRTGLLAVGLVVLTLLAPAAAMAQCEPFAPPSHWCEGQRLAQLQAEWQHSVEQLQEGRRLREQLTQNIANARARFWATYPDKPGWEKAQTDFAYLLWTKDLFYMRENLAAAAITDNTGRGSTIDSAKALDSLMWGGPGIDGAIRQSAMPEFEAWVNAVRKKVFEGHTSNSTDDEFMRGFLSMWMGQAFWKAVAGADKEYQAYLVARDWWEFDTLNRVPAGYDAPDAYGALLFYRWERVPMPQAVNVFQTFGRLVGLDAARAAAKAVHDAPKDATGRLVVTVKPPVKIGPGGSQVPDYDVPMPDAVIGTWASPVTAMEMLATRGNARTYLLFLLRDQNENGTRVDRATQWTSAESAYNRLKLAFGEPAILDAAERVRTAKKRLTSNTVMNQEAIGATRNVPIEAFEDILARKDPAGYVKIALAFSGNIDSAAALDGAYRKFVADHGESNVLAAATRSAAGKPYFFYTGARAALENEITRPTTPSAAPAATADSPAYLAWRDFASGAKATYVDLKPGMTEPLPGNVLDRQTYQLRSISASDAQVWVTQVVYDPNGTAHPPRDSEEVYPAKAPASSPIKTGTETLTIKGQPMVTQWQQTQGPQSRGCTVTKTTWTNDDVPGGVVRSRTDTACGARTMVQDKWLESFTGTRTRAAAARPASATAAAAPSAPSLPSVDRVAEHAVRQPTALSTKSDDQIVHQQLSGFALMIVTVDSIDFAQVKAGQTVRAKVNVSLQLNTLPPSEAERLQSLMNEVDVRLKLTQSGFVMSAPRVNATVESVTFRGQRIPVATYDLPQIMRVKPAQAYVNLRGGRPDSDWELPAKTGMTFRSKQSAGPTPASPVDPRGK
jgi:hypothetical protein